MRKLLPITIHLIPLALLYGAYRGELSGAEVIAGIVIVLVLEGPARVLASAKRPLSLIDYEVLPAGAGVSADADAWGREMSDALTSMGFVARARYRTRRKSHFDFAQRFDNLTTGEVATIICGQRRTREGVTRLRVAGFTTRFRDGGQLTTSNSPLPTLSPPAPGYVTYRIPDVADPVRLYDAHRRLVRNSGRGPVRIQLPEEALAWEREQNADAIARSVAKGYGVVDETRGLMLLTVRGALRASWLLHPALRRMHDRRAQARIAHALRDADAAPHGASAFAGAVEA